MEKIKVLSRLVVVVTVIAALHFSIPAVRAEEIEITFSGMEAEVYGELPEWLQDLRVDCTMVFNSDIEDSNDDPNVDEYNGCITTVVLDEVEYVDFSSKVIITHHGKMRFQLFLSVDIAHAGMSLRIDDLGGLPDFDPDIDPGLGGGQIVDPTAPILGDLGLEDWLSRFGLNLGVSTEMVLESADWKFGSNKLKLFVMCWTWLN